MLQRDVNMVNKTNQTYGSAAIKYCFSLLFFSVFFNCCYAQLSATSQMAAGFKYEEIIKGKPIGNKRLPLVVAFHYSGGTPQESFENYDSLQAPVRIIVVKGNYKKRSGYSYYPPDYYTRDSIIQIKIAKQTTDSIANFIKEIITRYKVKPVVSGISQGGDITFLLAVYYPRLIKASLPFAANIHEQIADVVKKDPGNKVPVFVFQGEADKIINVNHTRDIINRLSKYLNISLKTYPGLGHDISPTMKKDYSVLINKWLSGD